MFEFAVFFNNLKPKLWIERW